MGWEVLDLTEKKTPIICCRFNLIAEIRKAFLKRTPHDSRHHLGHSGHVNMKISSHYFREHL